MSLDPRVNPSVLPRIAITYCTQCKWMLRAAYFGQELLSTFGTTIGEVALVPTTGGIFTVDVVYKGNATATDSQLGEHEVHDVQHRRIWDRKIDGGFPEAKILKQRLRDLIEPERKLGHSDTASSRIATITSEISNVSTVDMSARMDVSASAGTTASNDKTDCKDCA